MQVNKVGRRILIIGCPGSGKSTLAVRLGEKLGLPVIHLDKEFWNAGWVAKPDDEWRERVPQLVSGEKWIVEGNYAGTLDLRIKNADTVIFLDFNRMTCVLSVIRRVLKGLGKTRPDLAEGCPEKIDLEFLSYVWNFNKDTLPKTLIHLKGFQNIITLKNRGQASDLLKSIKKEFEQWNTTQEKLM